MKLVAVLVVFAAFLLVVHADFYINLFYEPTQKYLSNINYVSSGNYMKAAKSSPDSFCRFKFVTSGLPDGKAAIQNNAGTNYFCRDSQGSNIRPLEADIEDNCIYDYEVLLDSDDIYSYRIALKADNGLYWNLGGSDGKFIRAKGTSPVYFDVLEPN